MSESRSVLTYLTEEIRELVRLGPVHSFTWVSHADPGRWMQVSVHDGTEHYLTALCVLPPHISKRQLDKLLGKVGRKQSQVNHGTCLIYYLAQCENHAQLLDQAPAAAQQCAAIAGLLWNASTTDHFELLGARGPKLPIHGGSRPSIAASNRTIVEVIPEASIAQPALSAQKDLPESAPDDSEE